ncbi:hypothetical protein EXIGLDRAFT_635858 [Exidia glandulosa HHB12029]|uniref:BRCT domain-containing protein n=1 Tax=Exidia glandulosa HHB12029 TaxID=1314781 RepID=A0A165R180_EXIGL|nr:hypothetical protein EXIGLDRAFT_635858 [Exidia glandulosa HHB12029]
MSVHASSPAHRDVHGHGKKKDKEGPLFAGISFAVSPTLTCDVRANITGLLTTNGATEAPMETAAFIISDTNAFEGSNRANKDAEVVTPYWVERSAALDTLQNPKGFSADPRMIFSGIVASSVELPDGDKEIMRASIVAFGGQWREMFTRDVTHFFCLTNKSDKYEKAIDYAAQSQMRVLLPHWFDDSFNARHLVPYDVYTFPKPKLFDIKSGLKDKEKATTYQTDSTKELLFKTALLAADESENALDNQTYGAVNVWQGRRVYLSTSLALGEGRRNAVETMLKTGGARVVPVDEKDELELRAVAACDVLVTRYREGKAFEHALRDEKVIGTLAWVLQVQHQGKYSSPMDQLLHFPLPSRTIPGMDLQKISITNYSGSAREYLRKLVGVMGGEFTSTLSHENTHVVAASLTGKKTAKAREWRVPIVNHLWLEDCFLAWELISPAHERYIRFPHHDDVTVTVGEAGIGKYTLEEHKATMKRLGLAEEKTPRRPRLRDREQEEVGDSKLDVTLPGPTSKRSAPSSKGSELMPHPATNTSMREANEVEGEMQVEWDTPHVPDDDERPSSPAEQVPPTSSPLGRFESKNINSSSSKRRIDVLADDDDDEEEPQPKRYKDATQVKPSKTGKKPPEAVIDLADSDSDDEPSNAPPSPARRNVRKRGRRDDESDEDDFGRPRSSSLTPPPPSSAKRHKPTTESQTAAAHEALSPLTNFARRRPKASDVASEHSFRDDGDEDDSQRRRSGRAAAAKATKTLKEVIMPDVVMFETKEKRGKKNMDIRAEEPAPPKLKTYGNRKQRATKSKSVELDEEDEDDDAMSVDRPAATRVKREPQATQAPTRTISYITTMVTLSDSDAKVLASLGAKPATRPDQCTHLIADQVVRTEKFLTAMNYAPLVVTKEWAEACVEAKALVPEGGYILRHPASEKKYNVKLSDALRRARENKAALFKGCTFYVTDYAVADHDLIKAVVKAGGGEVRRKLPNLRQAQHENTFIVSHEKDGEKWKSLAHQGIRIYNADFILNGALRQQLLVDDPTARLTDS